jgi:hypothetical protein
MSCSNAGVARLGCSQSIGFVHGEPGAHDRAVTADIEGIGLRPTALWPVVPLGGLLAGVVRPLPRVQFVDGVADQVSNAEAKRAFASCGRIVSAVGGPLGDDGAGEALQAEGRAHLEDAQGGIRAAGERSSGPG